MNTLTLIKDNKEYFLGFDGKFTDDITKVLPIEVENVSYHKNISFFRIKLFGNQYLSLIGGNFVTENQKSDNNLMYKNNLSNNLNFVKENRFLHESDFVLTTSIDDSNRIMLDQNNLITFGSGNLSDLQKLFIDGIVVLDFNMENLLSEEFNKARDIVKNSPHKRISDILTIDPCFQRLLSHPKIKTFVDSIFQGKDYHLTTYSSNRVNKDHSQAGWHIDYPYHNIPSEIPIETLGLQMLILLDDFRTDNGGTEYIVGSHVHRKFPTADDINNNMDRHRQLTAKKGSVVVWLGKLWHREGLSRVDEFRTALLANFSPVNIPAKDNVSNQLTFENQGLMRDGDKVRFI